MAISVTSGTVVPVVDLCMLARSTACPERLSSRIVLVRYSGRDGRDHTQAATT